MPKKNEMLTIKLTTKEHDDLREYAKRKDQTMSEVIRECIRSIQRKLKRMEPQQWEEK